MKRVYSCATLQGMAKTTAKPESTERKHDTVPQISVRLDPGLVRRLRLVAAHAELSQTDIVTAALEAHLPALEKKCGLPTPAKK